MTKEEELSNLKSELYFALLSLYILCSDDGSIGYYDIMKKTHEVLNKCREYDKRNPEQR